MRFHYPKTWEWLGLFAAAGVLAGIGAAYAVKPDYLATSSAQFFFNSENARNAYMQQMLSRRTLVEIVRSENLFAEERLRLPLEDIIHNVHRMIRMQSDGTSYRLEVLTSDPVAARRIAEKLIPGNAAEPLPVRPFLPWYAASGFGIGLLAFGVNALFRQRASKTPPAVLS